MTAYICITAGGTTEPIDTVRKITNTSTGLLGSKIADACANAGYAVLYVHGDHALLPSNPNIKLFPVTTVNSLQNTLNLLFKTFPVALMVHAMAVSDYSVAHISSVEELVSLGLKHEGSVAAVLNQLQSEQTDVYKMDSSLEHPILVLNQTPKIIDWIKKTTPETVLIGFKLLSNVTVDTLIETAHKQIDRVRSDVVIANRLEDISSSRHRAYFVESHREPHVEETKDTIAEYIVELIKERAWIV